MATITHWIQCSSIFLARSRMVTQPELSRIQNAHQEEIHSAREQSRHHSFDAQCCDDVWRVSDRHRKLEIARAWRQTSACDAVFPHRCPGIGAKDEKPTHTSPAQPPSASTQQHTDSHSAQHAHSHRASRARHHNSRHRHPPAASHSHCPPPLRLLQRCSPHCGRV
jgi:hypothetical protein